MLSLQPGLKIALLRLYTQNVEFFLKLQNEIFLLVRLFFLIHDLILLHTNGSYTVEKNLQ